MERNLKIVSTQGDKLKDVKTTATNWKELKAELKGLGYNVDATKVIEGKSKEVLSETQSDSLPEVDFSIFIMPQKTKSGYWTLVSIKAE